MRSYFSAVHLWAARHFAARAQELEENPPKRGYNIEHRSYVVSAVVEAWSFLEAGINELFKDCLDGHGSYVADLGVESMVRLSKQWSEWQSNGRSTISTLEKYQSALVACTKVPFDRSRRPYQDADLLTRLRNGLVHFTPESQTADDPHRLGDALRSKCRASALMNGMGNPYFPDHCLGAGCAAWSVQTAQQFGDEFFSRVGIRPNHQRSRFIEDYAGGPA